MEVAEAVYRHEDWDILGYGFRLIDNGLERQDLIE